MFPLSKLDEGHCRVVCAVKLISNQMEIFSSLGADLNVQTILCLTHAYYQTHKIIRCFSYCHKWTGNDRVCSSQTYWPDLCANLITTYQ